jgi:hypothetical protein
MRARILPAHDHEMVRQGLGFVLEGLSAWEICGERPGAHQHRQDYADVRISADLTGKTNSILNTLGNSSSQLSSNRSDLQRVFRGYTQYLTPIAMLMLTTRLSLVLG